MNHAGLVAVVLMVASAAASADVLVGKVVAVADGDTITLLDASNQQHRIRYQGIDAPERRQPFGERAKQRLAGLVFGKAVTATCTKTDRYRRRVCTVVLDGMDTNLRMLVLGYAWHFKAFEREQTSADRVAYAKAEQEAQAAGRGLWSDAHPVAPWDWRRNAEN
jgi:endonuclease YncB( thermonuclease family)